MNEVKKFNSLPDHPIVLLRQIYAIITIVSDDSSVYGPIS